MFMIDSLGVKMNIYIFLVILFCLQVVYWLVGRYSAKHLQNQEDYFLAGKSVTLFPLVMTFLGGQVGGGLVLGAAEEAYKFGWPVLLYPLGAALGLIVLGSGIGRRLAGFQVSTIAQIFETVYGSTKLRKFASALSVVSLFMILVAQIVASHKFLMSLGCHSLLLFLMFWAIVIMYTTQGGLKAVISTDMVQATFFSLIFLGCLGFVLWTEPAVASLPLPSLVDCAPLSSKLCGWLFMPLLFMMIEQDMGQRCLAGATPKIVSRASLLAGISMMLICLVPVFFGAFAKATGLEVPAGSSVLITAIAKTTGPWMTAVVGCAILAAVISTAASLMSAISSNLSSDFNATLSLNRSKVISCIIAVAAVGCSFCFDSIVDLLVQSYELSVSCLFVPIFLALLTKKGSFSAALYAVIAGALGFCLLRLYPVPFPREMASIALSFVGYFVGNRLAVTRFARL